VLNAANDWGRLRAVVRSEAGAVAEMLLEAKDFIRRGDWLNLTNEYCHLHVDRQHIVSAWFLSQGDRQHGVYWMDGYGAVVFSLLLVKVGEAFDGTALNAYRNACDQYGQAIVMVEDVETEEVAGDE
jgi:precorrin-3B C17-methyltransferase